MSTPDIRVRLSPEGIKEVIEALRQVAKEAEAARQAAAKAEAAAQAAAKAAAAKQPGRAGTGAAKAAKDVGVLSNALSELRSLAPTLGFAAVVASTVALGRQALRTADATGKMQQRFGGTAEELSGLNFAFRTNESDQEGMQLALAKTSDLITDFQSGSVEARRALAQLGLSGEELAKLSTPRALEAIAKAMAQIPPSAQKAALAQQIFGKTGVEMIPALDALAAGLDDFISRGKALGIVFSDDFVKAAAAARDQMGIIKVQAEGLAAAFQIGFAPAITGAMKMVSEALGGDGVEPLQKFGRFVGITIRSVIAAFEILAGAAKSIGSTVGSFLDGIGGAFNNALKGNFAGAKEALKHGLAEIDGVWSKWNQSRKALLDQVSDPDLGKPDKPPQQGNQKPLPPPNKDAQKIADARAAFIKQQLEDELKLFQEQAKSREQADKAALDAGLISLQQYFKRRQEAIEQGSAAEVRVLRAQRAALQTQLAGATGPEVTEADRIKIRTQIAAVDAEIARKQVSTQRDLSALREDERQQFEKLSDEQRAQQVTLATAENRRHDVFMLNLEEEIKKVRELGAKAGQSAEDIEAQVQRLTAARTNQFNFEEVSRRGQSALESFNRDAAQIHRDQEAGVTTQLEGEVRLIQLQRQRLTLLQALAAQGLAAAKLTGSPEQIEQAQQFSDSVAEISVSFQAATDDAHRFKEGAIEAFQSGFADLLANIDKIKSVGDAFKSLARTVAQSMARIAAEILARQATLALLKAFSGGGGGTASYLDAALSALGTGQHGGIVEGYARGGSVRGKKLNVPGVDNIPALLQKGEYVVRKSVVDQPGMLAALERVNTMSPTQLRAAVQMRAQPISRFATGGLVGAVAPERSDASANPAGVSTRIVNVLDPSLVSEGMAAPAGERVILNVIRRNAGPINRSLKS